MTSFNVAPFELYDDEHFTAVQRHNSNIEEGILFLMCITVYCSNMNEVCCHGDLYRYFMNMGCLKPQSHIAGDSDVIAL